MSGEKIVIPEEKIVDPDGPGMNNAEMQAFLAQGNKGGGDPKPEGDPKPNGEGDPKPTVELTEAQIEENRVALEKENEGLSPEEIQTKKDEAAKLAEKPTDPPQTIDFSNIGEGKFDSVEAINTAITESNTQRDELKEQIRDLNQKLEVQQGLNFSPETRTFDKYQKEFGEDAAALYGVLNNFSYDKANPLEALVIKRLIDYPDMVQDKGQMMVDQSEKYEAAEDMDKRYMLSDAKKAGKEIEATKEKLGKDNTKADADARAAITTEAKTIIPEIMKDLSLKVEGIEDLKIDVSNSLSKYASSAINYLANKGPITDETKAQATELILNQAIIDEFKNGGIVKAITKSVIEKQQKEILDKKAHPSSSIDTTPGALPEKVVQSKVFTDWLED